jgi:3-hydroxyisobutyrate dehydrogenase-like beta-hydroxyacid dehydrogenase
MSTPRITIGCAGGGTLGGATVRRLVDCGHDGRAWTRSRTRPVPLRAAGAPGGAGRDGEA